MINEKAHKWLDYMANEPCQVPQTQHKMVDYHSSNGEVGISAYCSLGVICFLFDRKPEDGVVKFAFEKMGLSYDGIDRIIHMNDVYGMSFREIAAKIYAKPGLFFLDKETQPKVSLGG